MTFPVTPHQNRACVTAGHSGTQRSPLRTWSHLALGCALLGPVMLIPVPSALAADDAVQGAADTRSGGLNYHIEPGPLGRVLSQFASRAGVVLSFSSDLTQGLQSGGLEGHYSVERGFARLLSGSGLQVLRRGPAEFVLQRSADGEVRVLDALEVPGYSVTGAGYLASSAATGNKTDTPLIETAQSISVITEEQIRDRQPLMVEQAVAYAAGVRIEGAGLDPRFDVISVRGFPIVYHGDFLDGLRQPNTGWLSYFATVPYNLERIDVVKGPDSVLYGQMSPGGLVNRVSKRPRKEAQREVQLQAGSHDHLQGQFDVGGELSTNVQYRLVGVVRDAQTDIEQLDNDVTALGPTLSWQIGDNTDFTVISQYLERRTSASPRPYQDGDTLTDFWAGDENFDKLDQDQWTLGYELNHVFSDSLRLEQNVRYGEVDTVNQYLSAGDLNGTVLSRSSVGVYENMDSLSTDTRLVANFSHGPVAHQVLVGADYARFEHDVVYAGGSAPAIDMVNPDYSQPVAKPDNVWTDHHGQTSRAGLYLQNQVSIDDWRLTAGIRRDWARDETRNNLAGTTSKRRDEHTTWRFGALYMLNSNLSSYFSYAQSFVPETGADVDGNDFDPTEGEQFEVGLKYQPAGTGAMVTAALYQITESNRKTRDPENPLFQVQTGEVRTRGLELEAVGNVTDNLRMTGSYNYNQAELTRDNDGNRGNDLGLTPRHLASAWLDYTVPVVDRLRLSGGVRYVGSEYIDNANSDKNDAYNLVDLAAHYDFAGSLDGVRVSLNANNVLDEEHVSCQGAYCYRGTGRSLIGSVSYSW